MVLELVRVYRKGGTNGALYHNGKKLCATIELPDLNNAARVSCIPEGKYPLQRRHSLKFGWHLEVLKVDQRSLILVHPANNAAKELMGCIAPVTIVTGAGTGLLSKIAFRKVMALVAAGSHPEGIWLHVTAAVAANSSPSKLIVMKQIIGRMQKKTPAFFTKLRNIGVGVAAVAATIMAGPVALPAIIIKIAGYLAVAGGVMTAVSQAAVKNDE